MTCFIVENEPSAQQLLTSLIEEYKPDFAILGIASTIEKAIHLINELNPELLFLDIELDDGTSFEILNSIDSSKCKIIFTTAYDNFAIEAFKFNAIDYLLKPYSPMQFVRAVDKAIKVKTKDQNYKNLIEAIKPNNKSDFQKFTISTENGIHIVKVNEIVRMEADGSYCKIYLNRGNLIIASSSLTKIESKLNPDQFKRVHKSHLVNIDQITQFSYEDGGYLILRNNEKIPVSRRRKQEILSALKS